MLGPDKKHNILKLKDRNELRYDFAKTKTCPVPGGFIFVITVLIFFLSQRIRLINFYGEIRFRQIVSYFVVYIYFFDFN